MAICVSRSGYVIEIARSNRIPQMPIASSVPTTYILPTMPHLLLTLKVEVHYE